MSGLIQSEDFSQYGPWVNAAAQAFRLSSKSLNLQDHYCRSLAVSFLSVTYGVSEREAVEQTALEWASTELALDPDRAWEVIRPVVEALLAERAK